ncbi:MAG: GAF domain-containing protein, partial [Aquihabitans sp.]
MERQVLPTSMKSGEADGWNARIQVLVEAALDLSDQHELDAVLARIVQGAAAVANARYAALGIYDEDGRMTRFVHQGMDRDVVRKLGNLPQGSGLLGEVLVADGPIRLADIADHPQSVGFPPGHPPMHTFLGVPIIRGGRRHGNLYVTEKVSGASFDDDDETLVVFLAAFAAGAIESALFVEAKRSRTEAVTAQVAAEERGR